MMQKADLLPGILAGSIPIHPPLGSFSFTELLPGMLPSTILQTTQGTSASALGASSQSASAPGPTLQQPIEPATLAALTLQSVAANNGPPSVETLQTLPTIPTPIETVSRANADAARLQSFISASRKEHSG